MAFSPSSNGYHVPILKESVEWTGWLREIKSLARTHRVWEYIDPEGNAELLKPTSPKWSEISEILEDRPLRTAFDSDSDFEAARWDHEGRLTDAKCKYSFENKTFELKNNKYNDLEEAMERIQDIITNSISAELRRNIQGSPRDTIIKLKQDLLPFEFDEQILIEERYQQLVSQRGRRDWKAWAEKLELVLLDSRELKVSPISDWKARGDLLNSIDEWDVGWSTWIRLNDRFNEPPPLKDIIAEFQREVKHRKKARLRRRR